MNYINLSRKDFINNIFHNPNNRNSVDIFLWRKKSTKSYNFLYCSIQFLKSYKEISKID